MCLHLRAALQSALVALALLLGAAPAPAGPLGDRVFAIEAAHGDEPEKVIQLLAPLEAQARVAPPPDRQTFLAAWGYAHAVTQKPAVADAAIEELIELGQRHNSPAALASAYALKATSLEMLGQLRAAFGWIESAVPLAKDSASPDLRYWIYMTAGDLATSNGQVDEGVRSLEAAIHAARESGNLRREAQSLLLLVPLRMVRGELSEAARIAGRVRELGHGLSDAAFESAGWVMESLVAEAMRDMRAAAKAREQAIAAARRASDAAGQGDKAAAGGWLATETDALLNLSALHLSLGEHRRARGFAQRAHELAGERNDPGQRARALFDMGLADLGAGHVRVGMKAAEEGLARMAERGRDASLLIELNRYVAALDRQGESAESWLRLRESLLLETELARRDRQSTVIALQRETSYQQRQRQVEQLQHDNALQAAEISRRAVERSLSLLLASVMGVGGFVAWRLYRRTHESNLRLARTNASLAFASTHDAVTGLLNRRAMEADTEALAGSAYCCVSLTVKQFSRLVGSVGHQQGDQLLCQIADRLEATVARFGGKLYRVDGVTFCAVLAQRGAAASGEFMAALTACMDKPFGVGNQELMITIGVGAAHCPQDAESAAEVTRLAELAKLQAQAEPGNTCAVYDARMGEQQRDRLHKEAGLQRALEQGEFELHYQGLHEVATGRFNGFEALLRWRTGDTMVSPADFIPLAEHTGLIVPIGAWVLRQACQQARLWADAGLGAPKVAVNISPRQFSHPGFMATVRAALRDTGVNPAQIELEITEGSVMNDAEASIVQLHALRSLGLQLAIDDFGTGYASLSYLRRFPLDRLKIDRSFIQQLGVSGHDDTIVRTVIGLAHGLGLSVTAEGVETAEQEAMLAGWQCDVVQGFLHSRPGPAAGAMALLQAQAGAREAA